jgi:hypothetical protein
VTALAALGELTVAVLRPVLSLLAWLYTTPADPDPTTNTSADDDPTAPGDPSDADDCDVTDFSDASDCSASSDD